MIFFFFGSLRFSSEIIQNQKSGDGGSCARSEQEATGCCPDTGSDRELSVRELTGLSRKRRERERATRREEEDGDATSNAQELEPKSGLDPPASIIAADPSVEQPIVTENRSSLR
ncbi:hypothetical protein BT93_F2877 [Corymbia citriodora subsp. variegata]|nr:hypothetical protein BT93_F2877 [Corymbia citriodora subsp. variegata]